MEILFVLIHLNPCCFDSGFICNEHRYFFANLTISFLSHEIDSRRKSIQFLVCCEADFFLSCKWPAREISNHFSFWEFNELSVRTMPVDDENWLTKFVCIQNPFVATPELCCLLSRTNENEIHVLVFVSNK